MIRSIERTWFEVWGTEEAQNRFLKALLAFFIVMCCVQAVALVVLALRKPPVIAVSATESRVLTVIPPQAELLDAEIRRAITGYVNARETWEYSNISKELEIASRYVHPDFAKRFLAATQDQVRLATEKKLSQRVYVRDLTFDPKTKTAHVVGDRILIVDNFHAAGTLEMDVQYDFGPRTESNPEGVYITGEKFIASDGGAR